MVSAFPRIDAVRGCVAIERGPEVLALESVDFGGDVLDAVVDGNPVETDGRVLLPVRRRGSAEPTEVSLVAYHDWAQRGPSTMRVWIPTA